MKLKDINYHKLRIYCLFCCLFCCLFFFAANAKPSQITPIKISVAVNSAPFEYISFDGQKKGFSVILISKIMKRLAKPYVFVPTQHRELARKLNQGKVDLRLTVPYSIKNEKNLLLSKPHSYEHPVFVVPKNSQYTKMSDLKGKRILVIAHQHLLGYLKSFRLNVKATQTNEVGRILQLIKRKEYDALFIGHEKIKYYLQKYDLEDEYHVISTVLTYVSNHFATLPQKSKLLNQVDSVLQEMKMDGSYSDLIDNTFFNEDIQDKQRHFDISKLLFIVFSIYYISWFIFFYKSRLEDKNKMIALNEFICQTVLKLPYLMRVEEISKQENKPLKLFEKATMNFEEMSLAQLKDKGLLSEESENKIQEMIHSVMERNSFIHEIITVQLKTGEFIYRYITIGTFHLKQKRYLLQSCIEISKLIRMQKLAEEAYQDKQAFLEHLSHEIRTPLNAINGFSALYAETNDEKEKIEYSQLIKTNNNILRKLVHDILDYSQIETGLKDGVYEKIDIVPFFEKIEQKTTKYIEEKTENKLKFTFYHPYSSCVFSVNLKLFERVVENLILNALKYTIEGEIEIGYLCLKDEFVFYVRDTGVGIHKSRLKKIFNTFEKLDTFKQGTGLGLAICKAIVQRQEIGSSIGVVSKEGKGSLFWVSLRKVNCETIKFGYDEEIISKHLQKREKGIWYTKERTGNMIYHEKKIKNEN